MGGYLPKRGDVVWLDFNPQGAHEQAGKRPAIVLSPEEYNEKTGLLIACPITSKVKGYPFEVPLNGKEIVGVVLSDQVKSLDWLVRNAEFAEKASRSVMRAVRDKLLLLIE